MSLIQCLYASTAAAALNPTERRNILRLARDRNARADISGILVAVGSAFVQLIEGDSDDVDELFLHIAGDPRHRDIVELGRERITGRRFPESSLTFVAMDRATFDQHAFAIGLDLRHSRAQDLSAAEAVAVLVEIANQHPSLVLPGKDV